MVGHRLVDVDWLIFAAAVLGFASVALGAFGAHALDGRLSLEQLGWYQTASHYLMVHSVAALACGALASRLGRLCWLAGILLCAGVVVFSGTLYAMSFGAPRGLGAVTPLGGAAMLGGWSLLGWSAVCRPLARRPTVRRPTDRRPD